MNWIDRAAGADWRHCIHDFWVPFLYRVTHRVHQNLWLTLIWKLCFTRVLILKRNFHINVKDRFLRTWCVTLYLVFEAFWESWNSMFSKVALSPFLRRSLAIRHSLICIGLTSSTPTHEQTTSLVLQATLRTWNFRDLPNLLYST